MRRGLAQPLTDGLLLGFVLYVTLETSTLAGRIDPSSTSTFLDRLFISATAALTLTTVLTLIGTSRIERALYRTVIALLAASIAVSITIAMAVDALLFHLGLIGFTPELAAGGMTALVLIVIAQLISAPRSHEIDAHALQAEPRLLSAHVPSGNTPLLPSHLKSSQTTYFAAARSTRAVLAEENPDAVERATLGEAHRLAGHAVVHLVTVEEEAELADPVWISDGIEWPRRSHRSASRTLKRAIDLVVGLGTLALLSPLMVALAILIKLESRGPALFVQTRVGIDGTTFDLLKFRSMRCDAEECTGPVFATRNDPRCTRIGRFMRRHSLDELPQLFNVVRGDMSIVGPRPERPYFVVRFSQTIPQYAQRHREKAGITGWAQVNGRRGDTSIEERVQYDLHYVENWSLAFDLKIMIRTVVEILQGHNAY